MTPKSILAIQGAPSEVVQGLLSSCAHDWAAAGARVIGLVEARCPHTDLRCLRDLRTGADYITEQDLGPGSSACRLIATGIMDACASMQRQIHSGCDIVILSKFAKLESKRSGLVAAFAAAVETSTPVLTAVSPTFADPWSHFAGTLAAYAPPSRLALDSWWAATQPTGEGRADALLESVLERRMAPRGLAVARKPATDAIRPMRPRPATKPCASSGLDAGI